MKGRGGCCWIENRQKRNFIDIAVYQRNANVIRISVEELELLADRRNIP
jgi:hypothetical protein